ncbi:hypothetical protein ACFWW5_00465 [Streptomyces albidoflavus]|uniref:hypothetical protein n=1 Tax=Streptomyces sp. CBG33 TaxID=2762624 RepID=UPI0016446210|nr:hypothetical protein [Streptomyces sp. CBG33]
MDASILAGPVFLTEPLLDPPQPTADCDVCGALMTQWRAASTVGIPEYDPSRASDFAVEIRQHPHGKGRRK